MASGRWLAEWLVDNAPRIPVRDRATLEAQYARQGPELVDEVIRAASRSSAAVGASVGVLVGAKELAPPAWVTIPMELLSETMAVAVIELKLVAELHGIFERPMPTAPAQRNLALVMAWAERRGVSPATLARRGGMADALGRRARAEAIRVVRRRLAGRLGRNMSSLAPLLAGALAGAEVNRRATRSLGHALARDLADQGGPGPDGRSAQPWE
ncbi:MAG: hypothetical protein M3N28_11125 [Actinomycetota bacterium]|nr:hypothetical protein [Actinomycetota bacterium]